MNLPTSSKQALNAQRERRPQGVEEYNVISVVLTRLLNNTTAAIFVTSRNGRLFQHVVIGDARGRVKAAYYQSRSDLAPSDAAALEAAENDIIAPPGDPPKMEPPPGIVSSAETLLSATFGLTEDAIS